MHPMLLRGRAMDDECFRRDQLQAAAGRLGERLQELRSHEDDRRRQIAYDKARVEAEML